MILAIDVDYQDNTSKAGIAGVAFSDWEAETEDNIYISRMTGVLEYQPGLFYKRELPCILQLLNEHALKPEIIIVDGFVFLDGQKDPGLGKYLFDRLDGQCIVIGVAKRSFKSISKEFALYRGNSNNPLYITSAGMPIEEAKSHIAKMNGPYRIPTLLKKVDQACRGIF